MDRCSETESICSESSLRSCKMSVKSGYLLLNPNDPILEQRFESIVSKHKQLSFECLDAINLDDVEQLKNESPIQFEQSMMYNMGNIRLTEQDCQLGNDDEDENVKDVSEQFKHVFGTALDDHRNDDNRPYLEFDLSLIEQRKRLNDNLSNHRAKDLQSKTTLTDDIEQQLTIKPLRISRRQRKKILGQQRKRSLPQWFNMPRVEEMSKEMEKDLMALKMRRVWNPKQFYKKSSQISAANDGMGEKGKYFQIGTVQQTATDFYSGRLTRRERKQTILDELMSDAQLKAFNRRKLQKAMTRNSRFKIMRLRAKKRRIRERRLKRLSS
ncbi:deoxynucleotidyltransferase terminal-interacting protein 2-like protein [Euroglyphus maynei]|uniref:Deoxynucleotidyltransferase terminal-interacting protein 2-like protein n=1 Tax=Euroglyphus maynei TaxID=6958 RepID=A0A1Y3B8U2_EURMA|nr:deoxynucleotidyltransferase terminal-interacting protein 2-like protein [Euroglyphus maynei]